jgi:hypothetical protein
MVEDRLNNFLQLFIALYRLLVVLFLWDVKYNVSAAIFMKPAYNMDLQECDFITSCSYHLHKLKLEMPR